MYQCKFFNVQRIHKINNSTNSVEIYKGMVEIRRKQAQWISKTAKCKPMQGCAKKINQKKKQQHRYTWDDNKSVVNGPIGQIKPGPLFLKVKTKFHFTKSKQ